MAKKEEPKLYVQRVTDLFLPGVTPEMLDWFWANIEKCYVLWHPTAHKSWEWILPPNKVGYVGATKMSNGGARCRNIDPIDFPLPEFIVYKHVQIELGLNPDDTPRGNYGIHQWEEAFLGSRWRYTTFGLKPPVPPAKGEPVRNHAFEEGMQFPVFLPETYRLWQAVKDPKINVQVNLEVKKLPDGRWTYETPQNRPPSN
jgi:hypothetical protein